MLRNGSPTIPNIKPGKQSYLNVPGCVPLLETTVGALVNESASRFPASSAIVALSPTPGQEIRKTYKDLKTEVDSLAAGLLAIGMEPGDRLGIWGPNSYPWYLTFLAAIKCGLIAVNINPAYQIRELEYCINKVGVKCMVLGEQFKASNYYSLMGQICPEIEASEPGKIQAKSVPTLTTLISMTSATMKGAYSLEQLISVGSTAEALNELERTEGLIQLDDICNIQFSSGTTGNPKGIMLSHHNIVNNALFLSRRFGYSQEDKICAPVPLFHYFGCVLGGLTAMHSGAAVVLPSPGFSPTDALESIRKEGCTVLYGTPTMHIDILASPHFSKEAVTSLKTAVIGGAVCPEALIPTMKADYMLDNVCCAYGLTEVGIVFQSLDTDSEQCRAETSGYPLDHVEVKIIGPDGKIVGVGDLGEMCIRAYSVMQGYWDEPEKTREAIDRARWFHTGDLAVMLKSGHARIVGRIKDMIIRGGENIYPREIEDFLYTHGGIQEVHVFSVPDFRLGEEVCAWVKLIENVELSGEQLRAFCSGKIAHYKIPKHVKFVDEFPKTASGKIQKFKMSQAMSKELGLTK